MQSDTDSLQMVDAPEGHQRFLGEHLPALWQIQVDSFTLAVGLQRLPTIQLRAFLVRSPCLSYHMDLRRAQGNPGQLSLSHAAHIGS